jgi:hypothetical protein
MNRPMGVAIPKPHRYCAYNQMDERLAHLFEKYPPPKPINRRRCRCRFRMRMPLTEIPVLLSTLFPVQPGEPTMNAPVSNKGKACAQVDRVRSGYLKDLKMRPSATA